MPAFVCPASTLQECSPANCHWRCARDVVDELLASPGAVSAGETDLLLDLRWKLQQLSDPEGVLRLFCELRRSLEQKHYLAFFRMRRWLENHLVAQVQLHPQGQPRQVPVKLSHFCVEAIRRVCLCAALDQDSTMLRPQVRFDFYQATPDTKLPLGEVTQVEAVAGK